MSDRRVTKLNAGSSSAIADEVVRRIRAVLPASEASVAIHEPRFLGNEKAYLADCIDTGWVSYAGSYVARFEASLAQACGVKHAIAVTSGTVAIQVGLSVSGLQVGDEVLVPSLTFVATANAIVHAGGVPHFVECEESTLGVDAVALAAHLDDIGVVRNDALYNRHTGRRIFALMPVHIFGQPVDMDALSAIARNYSLPVIEDATEALGSLYHGEPCGSLASLGMLSFNGNKVVTTGGGGAIVTDDTDLAARIRHLTTTAKQPHRWAFNHDEVGWNFRLPNINAALGLAQMERLPAMLAAKRRLWQRYADVFADLPGTQIFANAPGTEGNHWLITLILDEERASFLTEMLTKTNDAGLMTRPLWTPMHRLPMYAANPRAELAVTEGLSRRIVNLPSSPFLAPS